MTKKVTIFALPKPFVDPHITMIQRNALQSWITSCPKAEIVLIGNEDGVKETAQAFGVIHCPEVRVDSYGTPLMDSLFQQALENSSGDVLCYINADIILMDSFDPILDQLSFEKFLLVGERMDMNIHGPVDFSNPDWRKILKQQVAQHGKRHTCDGIDYFLFPRNGVFDKVLPFAIGRGFSDHWLIYEARRRNAAIIDLSEYMMAVHQNHGRQHTSGKEIHGYEDFPEYLTNRELMRFKGWGQLCDLRDAEWMHDGGTLRRNRPRSRLKRALADTWRIYPKLYDRILKLTGKSSRHVQ
ncbi:MAG: hypothetical protein PHP44_07925 [Kiritimatiellae bacterium]|nr:hypothetical protein [Kiritimatiellia bacterium]